MKSLVKSLFSMSIRTQLLFLAFIVALPSVCIIVYSGMQTREDAIHDARMETQRLAGNIATEQQNLIIAAQQLFIALSQLPEVRNQDRSRVEPILRDILKLNAQYSNIIIADRKGLVWATAVPTKPPYIISDRRYFIQALASGQLSSGEYIIGRASGQPAFAIGYPLKDKQGMIVGVIGVALVLDVVKDLLDRAMLPPDAHITLLDQRGIIFYRTIDTAKFVGKQFDPVLFQDMRDGPDVATVDNMRTMQGDKRVLTYRKLRLPGEQSPYMYIRVGIPVTTVLTSANKVLMRNLSLFVFFLFLTIFFAWIIGKRSIADRIDLLEKASRDLAEGNLSVRISDLVTGGELGKLGQTFDTMASQLLVREQALVESERNYRSIFDTTKDAIFVHDAETGEIIDVNKTTEELYGYSREEVLHRKIQDFYSGESPYSSQKAREWMRKASQEGPQNFEWLSRRKNGELFWTEVVLSAMQIARTRCLLAVVRDITERKRAEETLIERNAWISSILEASPAAIYTMNKEGILLSWNRGAEHIFGWSKDEVVGKLPPFIPEEKLEKFHASCDRILRGEPFLGVEFLARRKDGLPVSVSISAAPLYDSSGKSNGIMSIASDITHQKKIETEHTLLENQLRQAQKMEAVGQLGGGVAHDFNNILSAIVGYSHLSLMKMSPDDPNRYNIEQILESSERAAELTQRLLAFSRKQVVNLKRIDLNDIITKFEKFLLRLLREDIELKTTLASLELPVMADRGQIEQLLMNLVTNARDAMPHGGHISIETSLVQMDLLFIETHGFGREGSYATISVSDTGIGIPEVVKDRIFEPFFTTKEEGKGTGLGLSMVYGIMTKHEGYINFHSKPGIGTTFTVYLPVACVAAEIEPQNKDDQIPIQGGAETLLIAEDDASVRSLNAVLLRNYGYTVIEAVDGLDAVNKFIENRDHIRLVLLDGIMPKMNGKAVWKKIKALSPGVKVIFISGYAEDIFTKEGIPDKDISFIQKPSPPLVLIRRVRELLDEYT